MSTTRDSVLDDPVGESLRGPHAHLARRHGRVLAYEPEVATFAAVPLVPTADDWSDLATLVGPDGVADLFHSPSEPPADWTPEFTIPGVQLVGTSLTPPTSGIVTEPLGEPDVPAMLDLATRTRPGPFWLGTHRMGHYRGVRRDGTLLAMAGERLHPPGWVEISAVCTAPEARGQGLAGQLVSELAAAILARGERPFLHAVAENTTAIALYERLGFRVRREVVFHGFRPPAPVG